MTHIALSGLSTMQKYWLITGSVGPRPIALVTSLNGEGLCNAAPYSAFNYMGEDPPLFAIAVDHYGDESHRPGEMKDTLKNIVARGEFVVNMVDEAIVERAVVSPVSQQGGLLTMTVNDMDYDTTQRIVSAVNNLFGPGTASPLDGRTIQLRAPTDPAQQVQFMAQLQNLDVKPGQAAAKVILNARTGSIVMNQMVTLQNCAVAHGNLSVIVNTQPVVSQPGAFSNGQTVVAQQSQIALKQDNGALKMVSAGANLAEVVKALNALGATPADLMSILQAMKAAGALRADLEII